jgi:hypothetical protein
MPSSGTSARYLILEAVTSALQDINASSSSAYVSTVAYVSQNIKAYNQISPSQMPACFPIDTNEVKEHLSFSGAEDMTSDLTVTITSMLYNKTGVTAIARGDLLRDIERAMDTVPSNTALSAINVWHVHCERTITDQGTIPMYSIHDQEVHFNYTFRGSDGG